MRFWQQAKNTDKNIFTPRIFSPFLHTKLYLCKKFGNKSSAHDVFRDLEYLGRKCIIKILPSLVMMRFSLP